MDNCGKLVLNDETLVRLVIRYPLLYNSRAIGWGDEDYADWAWHNITELMRSTYKDQVPPEIIGRQITTRRLQQRWNALKKVMMRIKDSYELESLPLALRQMLDRINTDSEESTKQEQDKHTSTLHELFLAKLPFLCRVPDKLKMMFEQDFLKLLLDLEATVRLYENPPVSDEFDVKRECRDLLETFDLDEMIFLAKKELEEERKKKKDRQKQISSKENNPMVE